MPMATGIEVKANMPIASDMRPHIRRAEEREREGDAATLAAAASQRI